MGDLISRKDIFPNGVFIVNNGDPTKSLDELINRIWQIEAVDAVEVVRCKDCKRNEKNGGDCNRTLSITSRDYVLEQNVTEYITLDFCSYGERKKQ